MPKKQPYLKQGGYTVKEVLNAVNEYTGKRVKKKTPRTYLNHRVEVILDAKRIVSSFEKAGDDWEIKIPAIKNQP